MGVSITLISNKQSTIYFKTTVTSANSTLSKFKMRFTPTTTAILLSSLTLLSSASARIIGLQAPSTIVPGEGFTISLLTEDYIQSVYDVAVAFGSASGTSFPGDLGTVIASYYLGPSKSNTVEALNFTVQVDPSTPQGSAVLAASVMSLYGAAAGPTLTGFNVTVTVGTTISSDTVASS